MSSMDLNVIQQDLVRRFAEPLPEFYSRRIIFWYDEEKEFEDQIDDIDLGDIKVVKLTGNNTFAVKKLLCDEDTTSSYLVYDTRPHIKDDDNWLINVELYSEEFRADLISIWANEMGLLGTPVIRKQLKNYRKFFNARPRREAVKKLNKDISTAAQMHLVVMAVICGCTDMQPNSILKAVIKAGLDTETNELYQGLVNYDAQDAFWALAAQATGYNACDGPSLLHLTIHILLTAATRTMHVDNLAGLDPYISIPHQAYCYDFISDWLRGTDNQDLYILARYVEDEARLRNRFDKLSVDDLVDTECFPCINECILGKLMTEISDQIINVDVIRNVVEKRRTLSWYESVANYYDAVLQVANMQAFFLEHSAGFHTVEPNKVWKEYTTDYYRMDSHYRHFHLAFQNCLKESNPLLEDLVKHVAEKVEGLYSHWYLGQLGQNWSTICSDNMAEYGHVLEVAEQTNFYSTKIKNSDTRVFVIISDAFRYEVAAELAEQLRRETQSKVNLDSMQAIFPTITKFGMAALLPHQNLDVAQKSGGSLSVMADDVPTDANYRDKILKNTNPASVAIKATDIVAMKRAERSALVKGMDVVYIYHDKVDEASHTSDTSVFPACDDAIVEIKNLIRIIVNDFGGTQVYVTADHGFLYTYQPLGEDDKLDKSGFVNDIAEYGRRYAIMKKGADPEYLMPVKFMDGDTDYDAFAPRENVRIKLQGGGLNFVHGGASLQEMVVPLVEYHYLRTGSKAYQKNKDKIDTKPVQVSLLSVSRKISNMIFSLNFYQTEAVGGNREAATYLLYFTDSNGVQVSDTAKIIADKTNENGQERTFRCSFNLKSQSYSSIATYYLVIADESGLQAPVKEEFQIDIALAFGDFNFFG